MKEMVGGCCVCSDERGWTENPLVYCDGQGCSVAVHQACYGIVTVPTGPWFCKKCESQERAARVVTMSSQKRKVPENGDVSLETARCSAQQVAAILDSDDEETLGFDKDYPSDELKTDSDDNVDNDNDSESDSDNENPVDRLPVRPVIGHNLDSGWNKKKRPKSRNLSYSEYSVQKPVEQRQVQEHSDACADFATVQFCIRKCELCPSKDGALKRTDNTGKLLLLPTYIPDLAKDTGMVTGTGQKRRHVPIGAIYESIGPTKAAALSGFHSLTGADITGKFGGKGKKTCWKIFEQLDNNSGNEMVHALTQLGATETMTESTASALEAFVCKLYINETKLTSIADARWWLFKRKQAKAENMLPTTDALLPALQRAHYQAMIWYNDIVANPKLSSPQSYGWNLVDGTFKEVMILLPPAPAPEGWAHVVCALYIPEVRFGNVTTMEPIILQMVPPDRFHKICYICEETGKENRAKTGACMQCNKSGCKQNFHVTCAQTAGLLCEEAGNYMDNVKYCGYCQYHYHKLVSTTMYRHPKVLIL
ncbi:Protein AF-10 [Nymphon striatum]|nr:Protein AF-10 [Nymphon striatum]